MLGRKEVDRKLGGEPSGQSTGVERGQQGEKTRGKQGVCGRGKKGGCERGGLGQGRGPRVDNPGKK